MALRRCPGGSSPRLAPRNSAGRRWTDSGRKPTPGSLSSPVRARGWGQGGASSPPSAFPSVSNKGKDGFYSAPDSRYTGGRKTQDAGFLNKEAQKTHGILKWKCNLATRAASEAQNHSEQNGKSVLSLLGGGPSCQWQRLKQPKATQKEATGA